MEHIHMNHLRDLIRRLRAGESERRIAQDMRISRPTVHKYHELVKRKAIWKRELRYRVMRNLKRYSGRDRNRRKMYRAWRGLARL
jgi:response regulator of citrate/malate metabolism